MQSVLTKTILEASFQRLMEKIMDKLNNVIVYIDGLLIHSKTHKEHLSALDEVLQRLTDNNIEDQSCKMSFWKQRSILLRLQIDTRRNHTGEEQTQSCGESKNTRSKRGN